MTSQHITTYTTLTHSILAWTQILFEINNNLFVYCEVKECCILHVKTYQIHHTNEMLYVFLVLLLSKPLFFLEDNSLS